MINERRQPGHGVPAHPTIDSLVTALERKAANEPADLYPRDGNPLLHRQEKRVAELVGINQERLLLYPNGMTAVREAIEIAHPTTGTKIVYGDSMYSQLGWMLGTDLPARGVRPFSVNSGSLDEIAKSVEERHPDIIFFEPAANGTAMPVLDVAGFLNLPVFDEADYDPLIIFDNTTTPALLPPEALLARDDQRRVLVVESGTKFYGLNDEMVGIVYSNNDELMRKLRARRPRIGATPSDASMERLNDIIPPSKEEFTARVEQVAKNTLDLAHAVYAAEQEGSLFRVVHPNLPNHPNTIYANAEYPDGAAPAFFILPTGGSGQITQIDIARTLWANQEIKRLAKLGQSFGFDETRILINLDEDMSYVRISGGTEEREDALTLQRAFYETLAKMNREKVVVDENGDRMVVFGSNNKRRMPLMGQRGPEDCGQTYLEMLGYSSERMPEEPITAADLVWTYGADDQFISLEHLDEASKEDPVWVLGTKRDTGNDHWFLVADNRIINSENGGEVLDKETYLRENITEVKAAIKVPFAVESNAANQSVVGVKV